MRLQSYLTEDKEENVLKIVEKKFQAESIAYAIRKDCKKFRAELAGKGFYYRFTKSHSTDTIMKLEPRRDRRPRDMMSYNQKLFDECFYDKFGWKPRSEGVFTLPDSPHTDNAGLRYGDKFIFFPIGNYHYVWAPGIFDLYSSEGRYVNKEAAKRLVDRYINDDLPMGSPLEVTFWCKTYYIINDKFGQLLRQLI